MKQNSMLAMILAGGRGSRLHDLTNKVAKMCIRDSPSAWHNGHIPLLYKRT